MSKQTRLLALGLTLAALAGGGLFLYHSGFFAACASPETLEAYILRFSPYAHVVFFLIQLLSVVLAPIPSNISALAGGMLFGLWPAFLLTMAAVVGGSILVFVLARSLGQSFADRLVNQKLSEKYRRLLHTKTTPFLVLAFLFPYFPDDILCVLAGLTPISFRRFLVILLFTRPWGLLFASALGGAALDIPLYGLLLLGAGGILIFFLGMKYGDRLEEAILARLHRGKAN